MTITPHSSSSNPKDLRTKFLELVSMIGSDAWVPEPRSAENIALQLSVAGQLGVLNDCAAEMLGIDHGNVGVTDESFRSQTSIQIRDTIKKLPYADQTISSERLQVALLNPDARHCLSSRGFTVVGGIFERPVVLDYLDAPRLRIAFIRCQFKQGLSIRFAKIGRLCLYGSSFRADCPVTEEKTLELLGNRDASELVPHACVPLALRATHIHGDLDLDSCRERNDRFEVHGQMDARQMEVNGNVLGARAWVAGSMGANLNWTGARVHGSVQLSGCELLGGGVEMRRLHVKGELRLNPRALERADTKPCQTWDRAIDLREARIGGHLSLVAADADSNAQAEDLDTINAPPKLRIAGRLEAMRSTVGGEVRISGYRFEQRRYGRRARRKKDRPDTRLIWRHGIDFSHASIAGNTFVMGCESTGPVAFLQAKVGADLLLASSEFRSDEQCPAPYALELDRANVGGKLRFGPSEEGASDTPAKAICVCRGQVRARWIQIGNNLNLRCLHAEAVEQHHQYVAFSASASTIHGEVQFDENSIFRGSVNFHGAQIGGNIQAPAGTFHRGSALDALTFRGARIGGDIRLGDPILTDGNRFTSHGTVSFASVEVRGRVNINAKMTAPSSEELDKAGDKDLKIAKRLKGRRPILSAISFRDAKIGGDVRFHRDMDVVGRVRLSAATIEGHVVFKGGTYRAAAGQFDTIRASRITVIGRVFIGTDERQHGNTITDDQLHSHFQGRVTFNNARKIAGFIEIGRATFDGNPPTRVGNHRHCWAFTASNAQIDDGFIVAGPAKVIGEFRLRRSTIGHQFRMSHITFKAPCNEAGELHETRDKAALNLGYTTVEGPLVLGEGLRFKDQCRLQFEQAQVNGSLEFDWQNRSGAAPENKNWELVLNSAKVATLKHSVPCFPEPGRLHIDGFQYDSFELLDDTDLLQPAAKRSRDANNVWRQKHWLNHMFSSSESCKKARWHPYESGKAGIDRWRISDRFRSQPYVHLATLLKDMGLDREARDIRHHRARLEHFVECQRAYMRACKARWPWQKKQIDQPHQGWFSAPKVWLFFGSQAFLYPVWNLVAGYGHRPSRAIPWLLLVTIWGGIGFGAGIAATQEAQRNTAWYESLPRYVFTRLPETGVRHLDYRIDRGIGDAAPTRYVFTPADPYNATISPGTSGLPSAWLFAVDNTLPFFDLGVSDKWNLNRMAGLSLPAAMPNKAEPMLAYSGQSVARYGDETELYLWLRTIQIVQIAAGWLLGTAALTGLLGWMRKD